MKPFLFIILGLAISTHLFAQKEIYFPFTSDDENRVLKETDSGKYFVASGDTSEVVFINDETMICRVMNKAHKIICEGAISTEQDKYLQEGKWTQYYTDGKIKNTGYYYKNNPLGLWERFYPNGKPERLCNYTAVNNNGENYYCMAGTYKEYYENGQLKINGFYTIDMAGKLTDTLVVTDPVTGQAKTIISEGKGPKSEKFGKWEYYTENGELNKKEDF